MTDAIPAAEPLPTRWVLLLGVAGAAIAALNDTILRYELPIDGLMWSLALAVWSPSARKMLEAAGRDIRAVLSLCFRTAPR